MRIKVVCHYLGLLIIILGCFMLVPLVWSLVAGESASAAFAIAIAITIGLGLVVWRLTPVGEGRLNRREAILLVAGGWILASLFGTIPFALAGTFPNYLDALFESVSGFTTTGATVLTSIEGQPQSILLWRSITQWLGGMGIITLFVALFPILGIGAAHLVEAEMPGPEAGRLTPRIRDTAKAVWSLYAVFSALELVALLIAGLPFFHALTVTLSTMPTGGFTGTNLSIATFGSPAAEGIVIFFMIMAGVNFGLFYFLFWKRQPGQLLRSTELRVYLSLFLIASVLIAIDLMINLDMAAGEAFRQSGFQSVSIMTTTGFTTANFDTWPMFSRSALLILMLIGASAGSTGGALKVIRLVVLVKYTYNQILRAFNPRAIIPLRLGKAILPDPGISRIVGMVVLYFLTIFGAFLMMSAIGTNVPGWDQLTSLSSVISCVGNVGPGLSMVGPAANYEFIPPIGKGVLMACMLVGRLELFTMLILFVPAFWKWR
ncbi:MAG: TrkH family potassium uptake protein [Dehalococcoidales bacterium]|nr:MAG: TrkH family potassium uptake protein [Dehalococcoidales bacterium]